MRVLFSIIVMALSFSMPVYAQTPFRVTIPASAFSARWQDRRGNEDASPEGRRFWGNGAAVLILEANLRMHPSVSADPHKLARLVIHCRGIDYGPAMRIVRLQNGRVPIFEQDTHITGNFITSITKVNSWVWLNPIQVSNQTVIHLEVWYPTGFEGPGTLQPFILHDVEVDYPLKRITGSPVLRDATVPGLKTGKDPAK